jgi:hypothetical protein
MEPAPAGVQRLLGTLGRSPEELLSAAGRSHLLARLLEDGDAADLRWLVRTVGRGVLAEWLAAHGGRLLSRRSRAFWSLALERPAPPPHPLAAALWPL